MIGSSPSCFAWALARCWATSSASWSTTSPASTRPRSATRWHSRRRTNDERRKFQIRRSSFVLRHHAKEQAMPTRVAEILKTMEYGPAPESAAPANAWLDAHARRFGMFIDGEWTEPGEDRLFDSVNPANGKPFARITQATQAE